MEYQVPQFIEVEDKLIGPLTLKQFIYVAGAIGLCILFFAYLPFIVAALFSALIGGFAAALAFYKINGKPFIQVLEAAFNYYVGAKLFLWKHEDLKPTGKSVSAGAPPGMDIPTPAPRGTPKLTRGKLSELAWSLDVKSGGSSANAEK